MKNIEQCPAGHRWLFSRLKNPAAKLDRLLKFFPRIPKQAQPCIRYHSGEPCIIYLTAL